MDFSSGIFRSGRSSDDSVTSSPRSPSHRFDDLSADKQCRYELAMAGITLESCFSESSVDDCLPSGESASSLVRNSDLSPVPNYGMPKDLLQVVYVAKPDYVSVEIPVLETVNTQISEVSSSGRFLSIAASFLINLFVIFVINKF